jgi:hypothetical protein
MTGPISGRRSKEIILSANAQNIHAKVPWLTTAKYLLSFHQEFERAQAAQTRWHVRTLQDAIPMLS